MNQELKVGGNIQQLRQRKMEKTESDSDTRKMEKNGKTCSKTESDSDTEVKVSSLHTYFRNIFFNGY